MNKFFQLTLLSFLAAASISPGKAEASARHNFDLLNYRYKATNRAAFKSERDFRVDQISASMSGKESLKKSEVSEFKPDSSFGPANMTGSLDAPGGKLWYYSAYYDYEVIEGNRDEGVYYDTYILRNYCFTIYDDNCKHVGTIEAPMEYADDEALVVSIELSPVVSRHFFNTDDNIELMVSLAINTKKPGYNHYRTLIYSLPGVTDQVCDKPMSVVTSLLCDVVEGPAREDGKDNYYMIFADDVYPEDVIEDENAGYWDYLQAAHIECNFYAPAKNDTDGPQKIATKEIPLLNLPGDQESTPYIMSYVRDGKVNYLYSYLEEPFWKEYNDPIFGELLQRDLNRLNIEFYQASEDGLELVHKTGLDVALDPDDSMAIYSFYGVGDMNYYGDLIYDAPGIEAPKPLMVVTRSNYNPSSDKSSNSYFLYDADGKLLHPLALYCETTIGMSDVKGCEPQQMFVCNQDGQYTLKFVDIISGKERLTTSNYVVTPQGDYESFMANIDRVAYGDSYLYAAEMSSPSGDKDGNTYVRVIWLDDKGKAVKVDNINAGADVMYAKVYIEGAALDPQAFYSDDEHEYLYLVKRGTVYSGVTEELLVSQPVSDAQPKGRDLLHLTGDERGALSSIIPMMGVEEPTLTVYYYKDGNRAESTFAQDIYNLPLGGNVAIDSVIENSQSIVVEGNLLKASGSISIFSLNGTLIAQGVDSFNLSVLDAGIYIVSAGSEAIKLYVK